MKKGNRLSILGDSISTFEGISNNAGVNYTLRENPAYYRFPYPLEGVYWKHLMERFGWELCVNNSWSGGLLTGLGNPSSGVERANHLANNAGETPDWVIVFMGLNDLGWGVDAGVFRKAYRQTLETLRNLYPRATVICVNLPDRVPRMREATLAYNRAISDCVEQMGNGFYLADLFQSSLNNALYIEYSLDGLHPNPDGMQIIAEVIVGVVNRIQQTNQDQKKGNIN